MSDLSVSHPCPGCGQRGVVLPAATHLRECETMGCRVTQFRATCRDGGCHCNG